MNKNDRCVVAYFENEAAADAAVARLVHWDDRVHDVRLGAIGKIALTPTGAKVTIVHGGLLDRCPHLDPAQFDVITDNLSGMLVALTVNADDFELAMVSDHLRAAGGALVDLRPVADGVAREEAEKGLRDMSAEAWYDHLHTDLPGGPDVLPPKPV